MGAAVDFELVSPEAIKISGLADVVWIRDRDMGPGRPRGVGLQFRYLDSATQEQIDRIVERGRLSQTLSTPPAGGIAKPASAIRRPFDDAADLPDSLPPIGAGRLDSLFADDPSARQAWESGGEGAASGQAPLTETTETFVRHLKDPWATMEQNDLEAIETVEVDHHRRSGVPWLLILVGLVLIAGVWGWWWWMERESPGATSRVATGEQDAASDLGHSASAGSGAVAETQSGALSEPAGAGEGTAEPGTSPQGADSDAAEPTAASGVASSGPGAATTPQAAVIDGGARASALSLRLVSATEATTVLELRGDSPINQAAFSTLRLRNPDRFVVKVVGPSAELRSSETSPHLRRIRSAVHQEEAGPTLHIVLDLASSTVEATGEIQAGRLLVRLSGS
jgi:hypothetical protein